ncbi:hypothetical protein AT4G07408 [Arabidopsis thaliana]|nr:uncharacterized protein AT4G07408 [Arabidopsis thaliana]AEE82566.1 hypothetical protein AT4G07408 [Arabidopsis thaliana]|eukprot:NP_001319877.1 hypothetical protein AT4G07408 [Arabidopsis thaliana]
MSEFLRLLIQQHVSRLYPVADTWAWVEYKRIFLCRRQLSDRLLLGLKYFCKLFCGTFSIAHV